MAHAFWYAAAAAFGCVGYDYLQSLCPVPAPMDNNAPTLVRLLAASAAPASRSGAILGLLILTAFVLWIAGLAVRRMQISYGADT